MNNRQSINTALIVALAASFGGNMLSRPALRAARVVPEPEPEPRNPESDWFYLHRAHERREKRTAKRAEQIRRSEAGRRTP